MKFFKCPCCSKLHFTTVNGITFENDFITLQDFTIKKKLKCEKCQNNLAILIHNKRGETKIIWEEYYKVYDDGFKKQQELQSKKEEILKIEDENIKHKELESVLKEIRSIQNFVSKNQTSLRIKARITAPGASSGITDRLSGHTRIE
jgi:transcription elongation factor Elf1